MKPSAYKPVVLMCLLTVLASLLLQLLVWHHMHAVWPSISITSSRSTSPSLTLSPALSGSREAPQQLSAPRAVSDARLSEIARTAGKELTYLPVPDLLVMTMAKAASSMTWDWLYRGLSGHSWNDTACQSNIHNRYTSCWQPHAYPFDKLSAATQRRVLASSRTLRVAVQRHPFHRLVSAYKSKYTCDVARFHTHSGGLRIVARLRRQLAMQPSSPACMNVSEFGVALQRAQQYVGAQDFPLASLLKLDNHIRPQQFFFGDIAFDLVLDVSDLSRPSRLAPVSRRLAFANAMREERRLYYSSGDAVLYLPEHTAFAMHSFTTLSVHGEHKYHTDK